MRYGWLVQTSLYYNELFPVPVQNEAYLAWILYSEGSESVGKDIDGGTDSAGCRRIDILASVFLLVSPFITYVHPAMFCTIFCSVHPGKIKPGRGRSLLPVLLCSDVSRDACWWFELFPTVLTESWLSLPGWFCMKVLIVMGFLKSSFFLLH